MTHHWYCRVVHTVGWSSPKLHTENVHFTFYHPSTAYQMKTHWSSYGISTQLCRHSHYKVSQRTSWGWDASYIHWKTEPRHGSWPFHRTLWEHRKLFIINLWENSTLIKRQWSWEWRLPSLHRWRVSLSMRCGTDLNSYLCNVPTTISSIATEPIFLWWLDASMSIYGR